MTGIDAGEWDAALQSAMKPRLTMTTEHLVNELRKRGYNAMADAVEEAERNRPLLSREDARVDLQIAGLIPSLRILPGHVV